MAGAKRSSCAPSCAPQWELARSALNCEIDVTLITLGVPEEIRTPDPQIRSLVLYPAELRALCGQLCAESIGTLYIRKSALPDGKIRQPRNPLVRGLARH